MSHIDIVVPDLPESVADALVATWHKGVGDVVKRDEVLLEVETDKVILEVPAPEDGVLLEIMEKEGATVNARQLLARMSNEVLRGREPSQEARSELIIRDAGPAARRLLVANDLKAENVIGSGNKGRITSQDIKAHLDMATSSQTDAEKSLSVMSPLHRPISSPVSENEQNAVMLTTFNEVNMKPLLDLRQRYTAVFEKRYGVSLGLMPFYIKAVAAVLKQYAAINISIDGNEIVANDHVDISVALSTSRGGVAPVLRNADKLSVAEIEQQLQRWSIKGEEGTLRVDDLIGGSFTIRDDGVFGSLISTPMINSPQSAVLGVYATQDRPMAREGHVVILPMAYLALSYDHRLIEGKDAATALLLIKEILEDPMRLLLEV